MQHLLVRRSADQTHAQSGLLCSAELVRLQAALQAAFPRCTDLSDDPARGISAFRPHLSLGQWRSSADVRAAQQARANWIRTPLPRHGLLDASGWLSV